MAPPPNLCAISGELKSWQFSGQYVPPNQQLFTTGLEALLLAAKVSELRG